MNGDGLFKFGRNLNQLFLKFLGKFLECLVIVTLMLDVNFETWILIFSESDFVLLISN